MPAIQQVSLTLADESTPLVMSPISITGEKALFKGDDGSTSASRSTMECSLSPARSSRSSDQVNYRINKPLARTDSTTSETIVVGTGFAKIQFVLPDIMTDTERADLYACAVTALNDAFVKAYVVDLTPGY